MNHVAEAFGYPFRKGAGGGVVRSWLPGLLLVAVLPLGFVPLCGYSIAAIRASLRDPAAAPPPWGSPRRLLGDGVLVAALLALLSLPFAIAVVGAGALLSPGLRSVPGAGDPVIAGLLAGVLAAAVIGLPWGILLLVLVPAACLRFASSGRARDLFDLAGALRCVRTRFPAWNLVAVAIVTAWAAGIAGAGLLCLGIIPGVYFAVLVSAHATAALHD